MPYCRGRSTAALAFSVATDDEPTYTPEGIVTVAACYSACVSEYATRANETLLEFTVHNTTHSGSERCKVWRNILNAARACEASCKEAWEALGQPPTGLKESLANVLEADETKYAGRKPWGTNTSLALTVGLTMFQRAGGWKEAPPHSPTLRAVAHNNGGSSQPATYTILLPGVNRQGTLPRFPFPAPLVFGAGPETRDQRGCRYSLRFRMMVRVPWPGVRPAKAPYRGRLGEGRSLLLAPAGQSPQLLSRLCRLGAFRCAV